VDHLDRAFRLSSKREAVMRLSSAAVGVLVCIVSSAAHADAWVGTWKLVNGNCRDGLSVTVTEAPGTVTLRGEGNGRDIPPSERIVQVGADGSGKGVFPNPVFGDQEIVVPPGKGKRTIRLSQQVRGICQWELR